MVEGVGNITLSYDTLIELNIQSYRQLSLLLCFPIRVMKVTLRAASLADAAQLVSSLPRQVSNLEIVQRTVRDQNFWLISRNGIRDESMLLFLPDTVSCQPRCILYEDKCFLTSSHPVTQ